MMMAEHKFTTSNGPLGELTLKAIETEAKLVAELKEVRAFLAKLGNAPQEGSVEVPKPGEFPGMTPPQALFAYVKNHPGGVRLDRAIAYLLAAGIPPGENRSKKVQKTPEDIMATNVKIALRQKPGGKARYEYTPPGSLLNVPPRDITVWLADEKKKK